MKNRIIALSAIALLGTCAAWGSGSRVGFKDAQAVGRANATVATADRPSAVYYNPAGLLWQNGSAVQADYLAISLRSEYRSPTGQKAEMSDDYVSVPEFFAAHHDRGSNWAVGVGAYAPFGLETDWGDNSALRLFATQSKLTDQAFAAVAAWRLSPEWAVAAGVVYHRVDVELKRGVGIAPNDLFRLKADGSTWSWMASAMWRPAREHSFGLTYHAAYDADLGGTTDIRPLFSGDPSTGTLAFPAVAILGYSYRPTPEWNIEFNIDYTGWNRLDTLHVSKATGPLPMTFDWESGLFYEIGATRRLGRDWYVSCGYLFTEDSTPDRTYTPAVPDANRHYLCGGFGTAQGNWTADFGIKYALPATRHVSGSPKSIAGTSADGSYRNSILGLGFNLSYRF